MDCPTCITEGVGGDSHPLSLNLETARLECEHGHSFTAGEIAGPETEVGPNTPEPVKRRAGRPKGSLGQKKKNQLKSGALVARSRPTRKPLEVAPKPVLSAEKTNDLVIDAAGDQRMNLLIREAYVEVLAQEAAIQGRSPEEYLQGLLDFWVEQEFTRQPASHG